MGESPFTGRFEMPIHQQQLLLSFDESLHPHVGSLPVSMPVMMAEAQPTPAFTVRAPKSQFFMQAPHSMHRSRSVIDARLSFMTNTPRGQTSTHLPQPAHFS
jgi:hypothetical protein